MAATPPPLRIECPSCQTVLKAPPERVGRSATCPSCGHKFRVPHLFDARTVLAPRQQQNAPPPPPAEELPVYESPPAPPAPRLTKEMAASLVAAVMIAVVLIVVLSFAGWMLTRAERPASSRPNQQQQRPDEKVPRIELSRLLEDYKRNPVGTKERYGGKPLLVTGAFYVKYDKNRFGDKYILLTADPDGQAAAAKIAVLLAFVADDAAYKSVGKFDIGSAVEAEVLLDQGAESPLLHSRLRVLRPPAAEAGD